MFSKNAWTIFRTCVSLKIFSLFGMWLFHYCLIATPFSNSSEICKSETNQRWLIYFVQSQVPPPKIFFPSWNIQALL